MDKMRACVYLYWNESLFQTQLFFFFQILAFLPFYSQKAQICFSMTFHDPHFNNIYGFPGLEIETNASISIKQL